MDKCRPIEAGCLAIVIDVDCFFFGYTVQVTGKTPSFVAETGVAEWLVDAPLIDTPDRLAPNKSWCADTEQLLRIDDPDLQKEIENEQETVNG